jgi:sirohydrochlorin ferrochelatase
MKTALLLIAHGSREPDANADLHHVVEQLRQFHRHDLVEACFLELTPPDIDAGASRCVEGGADCIILLPYFLSAGVHVRRDLTAACQRLAERWPQIQFGLAEPLGRHPLLIEVLLERARQANSGEPEA